MPLRFRCTLADLLMGVVALACLLAAGRLAWQAAWGPVDFACDAAWSPDGRQIAVAFCRSAGSSIAIFDVESGAWSQELPQLAGAAPLVRFTPDSRSLVVVGEQLAIWDLESGAAPRVIDRARFDAVAVSPDGTRLAASAENLAACWDLTTGRFLFRRSYTPIKEWYAAQLIFSPDSKSLFLWVEGFSSLVRLDLADGKVVDGATLWLRGQPELAFVEGSLLVVGNTDACGSDHRVYWYRLDPHALQACDGDRMHGGLAIENDWFCRMASDGSSLACVLRDQGATFASYVYRIEWQSLAADGSLEFNLAPVSSPAIPALAISPAGRLACAYNAGLQVAILSSGRVVLDAPVPWRIQLTAWWSSAVAVAIGSLLCGGHVRRVFLRRVSPLRAPPAPRASRRKE